MDFTKISLIQGILVPLVTIWGIIRKWRKKEILWAILILFLLSIILYFIPINSTSPKSDKSNEPSNTVPLIQDNKPHETQKKIENEESRTKINLPNGFSVEGYSDEDNNTFHVKFTDSGYIEIIYCANTQKFINYRQFTERYLKNVKEDTLDIIRKSVVWIKNNKYKYYIKLINK